MRPSHYVLILALVLLVSACSPAAALPPTSTALATQAPAVPTETAPPSPTPAQAETDEPAATATGPSQPSAGLVFSRADGLWLVQADGNPELLIDQPSGVLSPDGSKVAYIAGQVEDLFLADLTTGERLNLSNTSDRIEETPQWWPARPDMLVFLSSSLDEPRFGFGHPTIANLDGSGYQVLDPRQAGPVALSPGGHTLAFGCCDAPATLYDLSAGPSTFDPAAYGIGLAKLFTPAWSPGGDRLAWIAGGGGELGVAIFDLQAMSSQFLHRYSPVGGGEFPFDLSWSPDGRWLAFTTFGEVADLGRMPSLWVMRADGQEEFNLGPGFNPVWSPGGAYLAFNQEVAAPPQKIIQLVQTGNWDQTTQLSIIGEIKAWIGIP